MLRLSRFAGNSPIIFIALAVAFGSLLSYLLALAGDPRSVWLWRDLLGLL